MNCFDNLSAFRRIVDCIIRQNVDTTSVASERHTQHNTTHRGRTMSKAAKTKREVGQKTEIMQRYRQLHREVMDYAEYKLAVDNDLDLFSSLCKYADTIEKKIWDLQGVILKLQMPEILK